MRRILITVFASLLAAALIAPAAQGATQFRQVRADMQIPTGGPGGASGGTLTFDFVFKNKRGSKKTFTPRQLTRIEISKVALGCSTAPVPPYTQSEFLLTTTFETKVKLETIPRPKPHPSNPKPGKPKPGKYAFRFTYSFPAFTGTITGTIKKDNDAPKPRAPMYHGSFSIEDLDAGPSQWNCSSLGSRNWTGIPLGG